MPIETIINNRRSKRRFFSLLRKNKDGATAIEFAMLGIPFAALLFGIVEISVLFFMSSTVNHAVAEVARDIRTGEFQGTGGGADEFKAAVCAAMSTVGNCDNLRVDVASSANGKFSELVLPQSPPDCTGSQAVIDACEAADPVMPPDTYTATASGDVVIVRVQYVHHLSVPNELTRLANAAGNTHVITATTAFKNEPF
ncbi:MAG: pilus assembly protein [Robiginitomaculum sp.]|nr:pilus assembly protein [Robiginitomaculum sp.]